MALSENALNIEVKVHTWGGLLHTAYAVLTLQRESGPSDTVMYRVVTKLQRRPGQLNAPSLWIRTASLSPPIHSQYEQWHRGAEREREVKGDGVHMQTDTGRSEQGHCMMLCFSGRSRVPISACQLCAQDRHLQLLVWDFLPPGDVWALIPLCAR